MRVGVQISRDVSIADIRVLEGARASVPLFYLENLCQELELLLSY